MDKALGKTNVTTSIMYVDEDKGKAINLGADLIKLHKMLPTLSKLCNAIEDIQSNQDGDIYIKFRNNVVVESNGSQVRCAKNGLIVDKAAMIHLNPTTLDEIPEQFDEIVKDIVDKPTRITDDNTTNKH